MFCIELVATMEAEIGLRGKFLLAGRTGVLDEHVVTATVTVARLLGRVGVAFRAGDGRHRLSF
jgi:hypothetical protein